MSVQASFTATLVDEWVRLGVTDAVICAGSRSTPLALPLAERMRTHVRLDERSAAFFALGLAMATGNPTVICVTSGTAAAELHAAVVEAHHGRVPLIVCTADRPPELHHTGAPQSIEQLGLFGGAVRWSYAPGVAAEGQEGMWRPLAVRAFEEALHGAGGPGPVHLNLEFREPLTGTAGDLPDTQGPRVVFPTRSTAAAPDAKAIALRGRGMIVAGGPWSQRADPARVTALADRLGWPVLADPLSGSRVVGAIAAADAIVRAGAAPSRLHRGARGALVVASSWVVCLGGLPCGCAGDRRRPLAAMGRPAPGGHGVPPVRGRPLARCRPVDGDGDGDGDGDATDRQWLDSWREREAKAQAAIAEVLGSDLSEPRVVRAVHRFATASGATLVVAASMPIRDLEWYAEAVARPPRVLANRGANGIDGIVSTALGVAASGEGDTTRTVALLGDLTFLHDVSGLVNLAGAEADCTFVVLDNGGGGIFSFLPQASSVAPAAFEHLFGTPPSSDLCAVARVRAVRARRGDRLATRVGSGRADAGPRPGQGARPGAERRAARCDQ